MKLFYASASPFVRKCLVVAAELGLPAHSIERLPSAAHPVKRDRRIIGANPLGQVPTLLTDDGKMLADSRVVCEYLNGQAGGDIFPSGPARWDVLTDQALADGVLNAALLARYEAAARPEAYQWADWTQGQMAKVSDTLGYFEARIGARADAVDIGTITLGCALGYLDFRFPDLDWRGACPALAKWFAQFSQRPSMRDTAPPVQ